MKLEDVRKLQQKKFREELRHFLVEGEHLVLELQRAAAGNPRLLQAEVYVTSEHQSWLGPLTTHVINSVQMQQISETRKPQGIVALVPMLPAVEPTPGERAIYLHEVQDPGNLGTILRTLAWFGNFRCLLSPESVDPYNSKVVRASAGAIFHVPVEVDVEIGALPGRFERLACLDMNGEALHSPGFGSFHCYLFGNEARGLPRDQLSALGARAFTIPGTGAIESLNLASAVNISLYELNRQPEGA